jgi:predicted transcriptional regulator
MQKLTKAEEDIMQMIWENEPCTVSQLIASMDDPKPPHSSVSSIVRILEKKAFVDHKAYGRTHEYFSTVSKEAYSKFSIKGLVSNYFSGSMNDLVSFLVKEEQVNISDLSDLIDQLEKEQHHD